VTEIDGPSWDVIAKDIRMGIASGEYPKGKRIPSTQKLMERYGVSKGPVRQAVEALRAAGLLAGRPGVGVYVTGIPAEEPDGLDATVRKLQDDVADLKADVAELQSRSNINRAARKQVRANEQSG
jgi:DNA-binding GntR family transcriptional regulator